MEKDDDFELDTVRLLVEQARDGDMQAKSELATQVQSYLTMMADRKLNLSIRSNVNPSDIVQHTLIRMVDGIEKFRGKTRAEFFGWLNAIVQNESSRANRHFRSQKRDVGRERSFGHSESESFFFAEPSDAQPTPQTNALSKERIQLLHTLLKNLTDEHADVIRLRNLEQLSFREIGDRMNRTEGAATKLWNRAIAKFQTELEKVNEEPEDD
ncbi:sigma-70 family RNA polymerase sigma factor [Mariniblastus fucicola]|uniref:sigma-70 family RNA polymerase sigma factor n=1 Tax=Mariniblastus fucicola TaxID=980251 RepID=UPI0012F804F3|nr:sigma-70 family RNA polymerase sigma factor [Mariniblastus fucicola]